MTEIDGLGWDDDVAFARHLVEKVGVAVVPGSSFYNDPADGRRQVRFAFCKKDETLDEAERRLARLGGGGATQGLMMRLTPKAHPRSKGQLTHPRAIR